MYGTIGGWEFQSVAVRSRLSAASGGLPFDSVPALPSRHREAHPAAFSQEFQSVTFCSRVTSLFGTPPFAVHPNTLLQTLAALNRELCPSVRDEKLEPVSLCPRLASPRGISLFSHDALFLTEASAANFCPKS